VGLNLRYAGYADRWDEIITHGAIDAKDFVAFYVRENVILAAAGNNRDREIAAIEELMRLNRMPGADVIRKGGIDLHALVRG
jgi:hypothetical protein